MTISKRNTLLKATLMISAAICSLPLFAIANSLPRSQTAATGICETCVQESQNKNLQALLAAAQNICDAITNPEERRRCLNRDTSNTRQNAVFLDYDENDNLVDPRVRMNDPQLNAIGLVEVSGVLKEVPEGFGDSAEQVRNGETISGLGTGFLINKCLVITNQHVAYLSGTAENFRGNSQRIYFTPGAASLGLPSSLRASGRVVASGEFGRAGANRFGDWSVIMLDRSYGSEIQPLSMNYSENLRDAEYGENLNIAALYTDREDGRVLYGQKSCYGDELELDKRYGRAHFCANVPGTSGAPIMIKKNGRYEAVGINSTQRLSGIVQETARGQANGYIDLQTAIPKERLDQIIAANPCPK